MKIFGREPALVLGFIGALLMALADKVPYLTTGAAAAIIAVITAAWTAYATRPWQPAAFMAVFTSAVLLLAEYGWKLPDRDIELWGSVLLGVLALLGVRDQATPAAAPNLVWLNRQKDGAYAPRGVR